MRDDWALQAKTLIEGRFDARSEALSQSFEHNKVLIQRTVGQIINERTDKQDRRLRREIRRYRTDFAALNAEVDAA